MRQDIWQIPFRPGTSEYSKAYYRCRKAKLPYPELLRQEKAKGTPQVTLPPAPVQGPLLEVVNELKNEIILLSAEIQELRIQLRRTPPQ